MVAVGQGQAFGGAEKAPSLTIAARDGDGNMRSGRKNARGAPSNKRMKQQHDKKWRDAPSTEKLPYNARIGPYGSVPGARVTRVPTAILGSQRDLQFSFKREISVALLVDVARRLGMYDGGGSVRSVDGEKVADLLPVVIADDQIETRRRFAEISPFKRHWAACIVVSHRLEQPEQRIFVQADRSLA